MGERPPLARPFDARLTFTTPFPVDPGFTGLFDVKLDLNTNPGSSTTTTQSLTELDATQSSSNVLVGSLPVTLGTVTLK